MMNAPMEHPDLNLLAHHLVNAGILSIDQAVEVQNEALGEKISFSKALAESKHATPKVMLEAYSEEFGLPIVDLSAVTLSQEAISLVDEELIRKHQLLPLFKRGTKLFIAIGNPSDVDHCNQIKFIIGLGTTPILADKSQLAETIDKTLGVTNTDFESIEVKAITDEKDESKDLDEVDEKVIRFVDSIFLDGLHRGASDIHFEPYEKEFRIRYRIDGVLQTVSRPPLAIARRIAARIKILSELDIAERRVPQDGRIKLKLKNDRAVDLRVSTLPTLFGEKVVLRILDPVSTSIGIEKLGFEPEQMEAYTKAMAYPDGMILVTGPTGSGKTVTLYTALNMLNTPDRNISTVEDPVEFNLAGINQVNINVKAKLDFASALKAFLRQDPDIIMLGEIRDLGTADIAIKAAQTGHLVLSTLHTNDAPSTLSRLVNIGVAPFNIASAVRIIIAQRLARRLCNHCKKPIEYPREHLLNLGFTEEQLEEAQFFQPVGCDNCTKGFKGRVGIYEVMPVSEEMGKLIMQGGNSLDLAAQAQKEGINNLRQSGLVKVLAGVSSLEEVERVTSI